MSPASSLGPMSSLFPSLPPSLTARDLTHAWGHLAYAPKLCSYPQHTATSSQASGLERHTVAAHLPFGAWGRGLSKPLEAGWLGMRENSRIQSVTFVI